MKEKKEYKVTFTNEENGEEREIRFGISEEERGEVERVSEEMGRDLESVLIDFLHYEKKDEVKEKEGLGDEWVGGNVEWVGEG